MFADLSKIRSFPAASGLRNRTPQIYRIACERLSAAPEDCLYVADGENHELKAAADFGMTPVLIRPNSHQPQGESRQEAREWQGLTISTLAEVLGLTSKNNAS